MHTMILGQTGCGKTTLARVIADGWPDHREIIVADTWDEWPERAVVTDIDDLIKRAKETSDALLIIDDAGGRMDKWDADHDWLATESRHFNHSCVFIAQRYSQVSPLIRGQCEQIYSFNIGPKDAKLFSEEFNFPGDSEVISDLPRLRAIKFRRMSKEIDFLKVTPGELPKISHYARWHANSLDNHDPLGND